MHVGWLHPHVTGLLAHAGAAAAASDAPDRDAMQLQLQDLRLDNVDALEALKLVIQVGPACSCLDKTSTAAIAKCT